MTTITVTITLSAVHSAWSKEHPLLQLSDLLEYRREGGSVTKRASIQHFYIQVLPSIGFQYPTSEESKKSQQKNTCNIDNLDNIVFNNCMNIRIPISKPFRYFSPPEQCMYIPFHHTKLNILPHIQSTKVETPLGIDCVRP